MLEKRKRREVGRGGGKKRMGRRYYKKYEVRGGRECRTEPEAEAAVCA